jgi:F-type H+-transporting ATPase subunit delta
MFEAITLARPYAKALFEHALAKKELTEWSKHLSILAEVVVNPVAAELIGNPATTTEQKSAFLHALFELKNDENNALSNLINLLVENKRLLLLPEIKELYEAHRAEQEKTLQVDVVSFNTLSSDHQNQMVESLSKRLQRKVSLNIHLDTSLLGGAIIQAGDLVIDGSVRGKLLKLSTGLTA